MKRFFLIVLIVLCTLGAQAGSLGSGYYNRALKINDSSASTFSISPGTLCEIDSIRIQQSAASTQTLTISLRTTSYTLQLTTYNMASITNALYQPTRPIILKANEAIIISWGNANDVTWYCETIWCDKTYRQR